MLDQICLPIKAELNEAERVLTQCAVSRVSLATEVVQYTIANKGKRIRPALFLLAARLVGAPSAPLPSIAASFECFHTASLLHDDVVDEACMRRGKQAARMKWGNQISVLAGDFLWCCATSLILESSPPRMFSAVTHAVTETAEGELLEITHQNNPDCDRETYMKIIEGKTAALFTVCGKGAAIMADASPQHEEALENYARNIGLAFQLTDDVLDYASTDKFVGKSTGSDLREGRLTLPLIVAFEKAQGDDRKQIRDALLSPELNEKQMAAIIDIVKKSGGIQSTLECAREHVEKAKSCMTAFKPSIERNALLALADYVVDREK